MKRRIRAKLIRDDIASGLTGLDLMEKHDLSLSGLLKLFRELVKTGIATRQELHERFAWYKKRTDQPNRRKARRAGLSLRLPIHDIMSGQSGTLRDISVTGLRAAGIEYQVGDITTFYLPTDVFMNVDSLLVVAECRWVSRKNQKHHGWFRVPGFVSCRSAGAPAIYQFLITEQIRTMEYLDIEASCGTCFDDLRGLSCAQVPAG